MNASKAPSRAKATRANASTGGSLPAGLTPAAWKALVKKVETAADDLGKLSKSVTRAIPDGRERRQFYWHLVTEGLGGPEFPQLLVRLIDVAAPITADEVPAVATWLTRLHAVESGFAFMSGLTTFDKILFDAYMLAPEIIDAREAECTPMIRREIAFVRGRSDRGVPARELCLEVLAGLADKAVTGLYDRLPFARGSAVHTLHFGMGDHHPEGLRELLSRFGSEADWDAALIKATRERPWSDPSQPARALTLLPLAEVAELLIGHLEDQWLAASTLMFAREDSPAELLAIARALEGGTWKKRIVRQIFGLVAAFRLASAGEAVPVEVAGLIEGFEAFANKSAEVEHRTALDDRIVVALRGMPAKIVHELVRHRLDDVMTDSSHLVLALAAHFDETLLVELYDLDDVELELVPEQVARIGLPLLEPLARIIDDTPEEWSSRGPYDHDAHLPIRVRTYALAFEAAIARGHTPDERFDDHLRFVVRWVDQAAHEAVLDRIAEALPEPRRAALRRRRAEAATRSAEADDDGKPRPTPAAGPLPPYEGVAERTLRSLVAKLGLVDSYQILQLLEKATGNYQTRGDLGWYFIEHDLLRPQPSGEMIRSLEDQVTEASAPFVAAMLKRLVRPVAGAMLPSWTWSLDAMVWRAYRLAPEAFRAHEAEYTPAMRRGLAFVRGRCGEPIAKEMAEDIVRQLARGQATQVLSLNSLVPYLDDGEEVGHRLETVDEVRTLALRFGDAAMWDRLFANAVYRNQWREVRNVEPALKGLPLARLVRLLATRPVGREIDAEALRALFAVRADPPEALMAAAQSLVGCPERAAGSVRVALALAAIAGFGARGEAIPEALDTLGEA